MKKTRDSRTTKMISQSGNWTPVSRVTGGDTHHYTNWEVSKICVNARVTFKDISGRCITCIFYKLNDIICVVL